ncbi:cAMP-binding protein [Candidatus Propionivibrio aalborgensis]|uniref:cAMP-binding protein n=1 Tax=Candidatus Propionivibrio aalborgensis TaxID=1860101 RepID=A0A1A8XFC2_9RHOO|nr:Crp/Fnr family transcriptional regulator [Candidatus Propionivibrio aalborgensis]SBT03421.1 cAMP-binding protein [Candidatus Propionivibrio aalborgensis]
MIPALSANELLALYPSLAGLEYGEVTALCRPDAVTRLTSGTVLFAERQPCNGFPLLLSGTIKVVKSMPAGREMLLYRIEPGGSCVITSSCLLGHMPYSARGIAETALQIAILPKTLFERLIAGDATFRDFVFHLLADRIADLMQLVEEVAFHRLDQRLAKLLLGKSEPIQATHQGLADELGSVREIVSRLLKGFAAQGFVSIGRERISLLDRDGLKQLAGIDRK